MIICNPILKGFNPDPSIIRVDKDYYIATSTFEWFPGVQIHHSRDLKNWRLLTRPLSRTSQLDMRGVRASGGVWAPCLSYDGRQYYLVYTVVKTDQRPFMDSHNYLVTSCEIDGEWSEPIYLHSRGFDPSLFHDEAKKWLVFMECDFRPDKKRFSGIFIQEYSDEEKKLVGPITKIFDGTRLGFTEGPHLYKKGDYYYLITAEGGTGYGHAVTMARSKSIYGPYETDPFGPILTSFESPDNPLQKAGHADIVDTPSGSWYMVHLCGRPISRKGRCILGRETAIQKVMWTDDDWLRLTSGKKFPEIKLEIDDFEESKSQSAICRDNFDSNILNIDFQTLRTPLYDFSSLTQRKGYLRLIGQESLFSKQSQTLVARRQQSFTYRAQTCLEFAPVSYRQSAGLICLYDHENFCYLRISHDETLGITLGVLICVNGSVIFPSFEVPINGHERIYLKVEVKYDLLQFYYSTDDKCYDPIGECVDASTMSDEACREGKFTGAFVGLCCQDLTGEKIHADFDYFEYVEFD